MQFSFFSFLEGALANFFFGVYINQQFRFYVLLKTKLNNYIKFWVFYSKTLGGWGKAPQ